MAEGQRKYRIVIVPEAREGFQQIVQYLEENVSYHTADYVRQAIFDGIGKLLTMPHQHGLVKELSDEEITYRRVLVLKGTYRIIFTIIEAKHEVRIIDISRGDRSPDYLEEVKTR